MEAINGQHESHITQETRPSGPDTESGKRATSKIQVLVLHAHGIEMKWSVQTLDTIEQTIMAEARSANPALNPSVFCPTGTIGQPNVRFLPDLSQGKYWPPHAWDERAAIETQHHHFFFTQAEGDKLLPNGFLANYIAGDAFILKLSNTPDQDGVWSYEDLLPGLTKEELQEEAKKLFDELFLTSGKWLDDVAMPIKFRGRPTA